MSDFRIDGLTELSKILSADVDAAVGVATFLTAAELQNRLAPYPPSTSANQPKPAGGGAWYERGYGPRWTRKDGSVGGRKSSETMNRRWGIRRAKTYTTLYNRASYSPFVHGHPRFGQPSQAKIHAQHGWRTDGDVMDEMLSDGTVTGFVSDALDKVLK